VGHVESFELRRKGHVVARIQGTSAGQSQVVEAGQFHRDREGLFTVGVAYGTDALPGREGDRVHYMALGGRHQPGTVDCEPGIAHYSGTPQGRGPREIGPHGCTLVQIDETGHVKNQFIATDTVRWLEETVEITASTRSEELEKRLETSLEKLQARHPGVELLICWRVCGVGPLVHRLRAGGLADEIIDRLRRTYGERSPAAYTATIESDSPLSVPAEWYDEQTVVGDLLREFNQFEKDESLALELSRFLPAGMEKDPLAGIAEISSPEVRNCLLQSAVKLGVDLIDVPVDEALQQQAEEAA
jgi:exonuclease SbcD